MSEYPVSLTYAPDEGQNRLWGIPLLGMIVRAILCIPQAIILGVLVLVLYVVLVVNWIPVLVNGRQAGWILTFTGGFFRLSARVTSYILLLTGAYPPFWIEGEHPVNLTIEGAEDQNRLWGIPFVGVLVRAILVIPHLLVLWVIAFIVGILVLVAWIPILVNGRAADWAIRWIGGFYRWSYRVYAYLLLLTSRYPPFSLE